MRKKERNVGKEERVERRMKCDVNNVELSIFVWSSLMFRGLSYLPCLWCAHHAPAELWSGWPWPTRDPTVCLGLGECLSERASERCVSAAVDAVKSSRLDSTSFPARVASVRRRSPIVTG